MARANAGALLRKGPVLRWRDFSLDQQAAIHEEEDYQRWLRANPVAAQVALERDRLAVRQKAQQQLDAMGWQPPAASGSLAEQLANPPEPVSWQISELAFEGANVVIVAVAKSGKTVLALNVARSVLSGDALFNRFPVEPTKPAESVAWWNAELSDRQAMAWLRDMQFSRPDDFHPLHLRGYPIPLEVPEVEKWAVGWLRDRRVSTWILDPKSALFTGEENSATETGAWLAALDRIKRQAGVKTLYLVHHASEAPDAEEADDRSLRLLRGRGSTRLEGWADVIWSYSGRFDEPRYLAALGRDVDLPPFGGLRMDPTTRVLAWDGKTTTPRADRRAARATQAFDVLVAAGVPLRSMELQGRMAGAKPTPKREAIDFAVQQGWIRAWSGPSNSTLHEPGATSPHRHPLPDRPDDVGGANQ